MGNLISKMNKLVFVLGMVSAVASYSVNGHMAVANIG